MQLASYAKKQIGRGMKSVRRGREEEERIMYNWYPNYKMSLPTPWYIAMPISLVLGTLTYTQEGLWYTVSTATTNSKSLHFTCLESAALLTPSN